MNAIGIDIGTTSICGISVDIESGSTLRSIEKNSNAFIKTQRPWEKIQSVEKIFDLAKDILDTLIDTETVAIGITGQMHGIVYTDKSGAAVSDLYTWQDGRGDLEYCGTTYAKALGSFSGYGNVTDFYNRINGEVPKNAAAFCTIGDYLAMRLCGLKKPLIHTSNAASLGCFDMQKNRFTCDCDAETASDCRILGEYKNIPVSIAVGDNQASVFSALTDEDELLINVGTGSQISVICDTPLACDGIEIRPYFDNKYLAVGAALCGGRAYSLLKDFVGEILGYANVSGDGAIYDVMKKMAMAVKAPSLNVDTRFDGTRDNAAIRGSVTNIGVENFRCGELVCGVLDGIITELYEMYVKMGVDRHGIVATGNGIRKNQLLIDSAERRFSAKLKIPVHIEEAAYGAALVSMVACGIKKNSADAQKLIKYRNENN